jgi:pimeloyl-ACP methyl ester carboxylesterase
MATTKRGRPHAKLPAALILGALFGPQAGGADAPALTLAACSIHDADGLVSIEARCGRLAVPENPGDSGGRKIELAVAVVPAVATQARPDPLFLIAGGPGQGSIETFALQLGAFAGIRRERDIVLVDQRGTGSSNRLTCAMPEEALETGDLPPAEMQALAEECLAELPAGVEFYTTSVAVRDLDAVREALGYERVNLYGGSYGTRVAQHYARRYPDRTRSVVLDGLVPPGFPLVERIAIASQEALDRVFARCAAADECNRRFPALADQFERIDERLSGSAISLEMPDPVTGAMRTVAVTRAHLVLMARMLTYSAETASLLPLLVHEAATNGNYRPLAAQGEMLGEELERMIAMGMHHSVVCAEDTPRFGGDVDRAALEETVIGPIMVDGMQAICEAWPRGPVDDDFHEPLDSAVPALLLSGEFDPATPPAYGAEAAKGFRDGLHVVVPGQGHGQLASPCIQRLIRHFIEQGSVAALDTACVDVVEPAPFFLSFSGPAP